MMDSDTAKLLTKHDKAISHLLELSFLVSVLIKPSTSEAFASDGGLPPGMWRDIIIEPNGYDKEVELVLAKINDLGLEFNVRRTESLLGVESYHVLFDGNLRLSPIPPKDVVYRDVHDVLGKLMSHGLFGKPKLVTIAEHTGGYEVKYDGADFLNMVYLMQSIQENQDIMNLIKSADMFVITVSCSGDDYNGIQLCYKNGILGDVTYLAKKVETPTIYFVPSWQGYHRGQRVDFSKAVEIVGDCPIIDERKGVELAIDPYLDKAIRTSIVHHKDKIQVFYSTDFLFGEISSQDVRHLLISEAHFPLHEFPEIVLVTNTTDGTFEFVRNSDGCTVHEHLNVPVRSSVVLYKYSIPLENLAALCRKYPVGSISISR